MTGAFLGTLHRGSVLTARGGRDGKRLSDTK